MKHGLKLTAGFILFICCAVLLCGCGQRGECRVCGQEKDDLTVLTVADEEWKVCPECMEMLLSAYREAHSEICDNCGKKCEKVKDISVNGKTKHVCGDCYRELSKGTCALCNGKYDTLYDIVMNGESVQVCENCRDVVNRYRAAYDGAAEVCDFCGNTAYLYDVETGGETLRLCSDCKKVKKDVCAHCGAEGYVLESKVNGAKMLLCAGCSKLGWGKCAQCGSEGLLTEWGSGNGQRKLCGDCLRLYIELDGMSGITSE